MKQANIPDIEHDSVETGDGQSMQKFPGLTKTGGVLGTATGVYGTAAALMALLAGYAVYKHQRKDDPAKGMAEALDERTRLRALSSPPPIRLSTEKDTEDQA